MHAPIIFLDFDGVISASQFLNKVMFDQDCIVLLRDFVVATKAEVVVSSDWRMHLDYTDIISLLQPEINRLHKSWCTPVLEAHSLENDTSVPRGVEIITWLYHHPEITRYVILDDLPPYEFVGVADHHVHCEHLLNETHLRKAKGILCT